MDKLMLLFFSLMTFLVVGQEEEVIEDVPFVIIEKAPLFPGCEIAKSHLKRKCLNEKILAHFNRNFSANMANKLGLEVDDYEVFYSFKIDKQSNIFKIEVKAPHPLLEEEIKFLIKTLPKIKSGTQRGKPVEMKYKGNFNFSVEKKSKKISRRKRKRFTRKYKKRREKIIAFWKSKNIPTQEEQEQEQEETKEIKMFYSLEEALKNPKEVRGLQIRDKGIIKLPKKIKKLVNLESLRVHHNKLTTIPKFIFSLKKLKRLEIGGNNLKTVPKEIGELTNLEYLGLKANGLKTIPESIGKLTKLKILDLSFNPTESLPESIKYLTELRSIYLTGSKIPEEDFDKIKKLLPQIYGN